MGKGRAPCCDKNQVKRGPWSPAEDLRLITFIRKHGHDNWRALPKQAGLLRCGKSCRLRWINYLRPDVKRGNFTRDEEETIIKLHKAWGNKWSKIASRLPGRTDNEIKNVWNTHLKKRLQPNNLNISDNSGDESKQYSPTTSSASSSSSKNSVAEKTHGDRETNTQQFSPRSNTKEQTSCSVLSFESTNTSNSWPEDAMDSQFEFVEIMNNTAEEEMEKKKKSVGNIGMDQIPFECDIDFWNMLDLDNIDFGEAEGSQGSNFGAENSEEQLENNKLWFRYLESELGLDQLPKEENFRAENEGFTENPDGKLVEFEALHWSKANPEMDPCMAYFEMGPPLTYQQPHEPKTKNFQP